MTQIKFNCKWRASGDDTLEYRHTMADISLHVGNVNLMENEDIWSKTIRESALLSAYPLAMWMASSWWRLHWEPPPRPGVRPSVDWRMAHEIGAADHGFVWPQIVFASDGEMMQVWAAPAKDNENQSLRYLNSLEPPAFIPLSDFQCAAEDFISTVNSRLDAQSVPDADLAHLWRVILEDSSNQKTAKRRRLEAKMGYDPDECPEELMDRALELEKKIGEGALSELAPIYGGASAQNPLRAIEEIGAGEGLVGTPTAAVSDAWDSEGMPWQRAVADAGALRRAIGNMDNAIDSAGLCELLGLRVDDVEQWSPEKRNDAAFAVPMSGQSFKFIPRKKHPTGKRFELARFIGDYLLTGSQNGGWLTSTDLSTARQKYQRAFAAEFLCPIAALRQYLQNDFSESAVEDAAENFKVSETTVKSLLINNGLISYPLMPDIADFRTPYHLDV